LTLFFPQDRHRLPPARRDMIKDFTRCAFLCLTLLPDASGLSLAAQLHTDTDLSLVRIILVPRGDDATSVGSISLSFVA
jgi:hypothetical protein